MFNVLKRLSAWLSPASRSRSFRPRFDCLEERLTPANNVQATLSAGTLTISTVDLLTESAVLNGENDQKFEILAAGTGNVTLHKNGATNINGGVVDVPFTGVVNIIVNVGEGDDFVVFKGGVDVAGNINFNGGDGNNTMNLNGDVTGTTKVKNLTVNNGDGVDNVAFLDGNVIISGALSINTGDGSCNVNIGFNAADNVTIAGPLNITSGAGSDNIIFSGHDFSCTGLVAIKGGTGDNSIRFAYQNTLVFTKLLTVTQGPDDDTFTVSATNKTSSFAGITINHGGGDNTVTFDSTTSDTITGNLAVINGAGIDQFTADSADFKVTGNLTINNANGNSTIDITPTNTNIVQGGFVVGGLAGKDTLTVGGATVNYKAVTIINGNGDTTTTLTGGNLSFSSISITNADGLDTFNVSGTTTKFEVLVGGLTLNNNTGGSSTRVESGTVTIQGALNITNGDGVDFTLLGNGAGNVSLHGVTIKNGNDTSTTGFTPVQLGITGSISVTNGNGFDTFALAGTTTTVSGSVTVNHGIGGSNNNLLPSSGGTISGAFSITGGDGNDKVDVIRTTFSGAITLNLGAGKDEVEIDNSILAALTINLGSGNDILEIEATTNDGIGTTILGLVSIKTGSGDDTIDFGLDANDKVTASKAITLNGELGIDTFDQNAATNIFAFAPLLQSLEVQTP